MHSPFRPLPGSGHPRRGLFIDRWGTLFELPGKGYASRFEQAEFTPGAMDALFRAGQSGWTLYLVGNEASVAFGRLSLSKWEAFEQDMLEHLRSHGIPIQRSYACTDHPAGSGSHAKDSVFLFPNTGCLYHAAQVDGIALRHSWVIGDSSLELVAGWRAGCRLAGVRTGLGLTDGQLDVEPDIVDTTLAGVLAEVTAAEHIPHS